MKRRAHCHWLIAKTAREFAGEFYQRNASDNAFYRAHPSEREFIAAYWGKFTETAREIMAKMLAGSYPESMKEQIAEALMADVAMAAGRRRHMLQ